MKKSLDSMDKTKDLAILLPRPSTLYLGSVSNVPGYAEWGEHQPDAGILPDAIFDPKTREFLGVCYPLHARSFEKEMRRVIVGMNSEVVTLFEHPVPSYLRGYGEGVPILTICWASADNVDSEVTQIAEAVWFSNDAFWRRNRTYPALTIFHIDRVLENNELLMPQSLTVPISVVPVG